MKSKNDVSECIHCHVCQKHCEFLKKYGIDIGDTEKLKELSYHCFLCGKCTDVYKRQEDNFVNSLFCVLSVHFLMAGIFYYMNVIRNLRENYFVS